jgi:two-component system OmpR family response regulator
MDEVGFHGNAMNATPNLDDLDFTGVFDSPAKSPPSLTASSETQRKEVIGGAFKLQETGYCINIVRPAPKVAPLARGDKRSILCIDDEEPVLEILRRKLSGDGYDVRTASDRQTIVAELRKLPLPNLILLDVGLPGFSGFDLLQKLRQHPRFESVPVIMLTGHVNPEDVLHGMLYGADGYVSKPVRFDALADAIKAVLGIQ